MTIQPKALSNEIIAHWPEVFEEVSLNIIPLQYIHSVIINFKDSDSWEIKLTTKTSRDLIKDQLAEVLESYEHRIDDVDIKLDAIRVKKDIEKLTKRFFKKIKL